MAETPVISALFMDRSEPLGNSLGDDARRRLHVKVTNGTSEPIPVLPQSPLTNPTYFEQYAEDPSVGSGFDTTLIQYTVPASKTLYLKRVSVTGENIATYTLMKNGNPIQKIRTYFSGGLNAEMLLDDDSLFGLQLVAGDTIEVHVTHSRPFAGEFNARIQGVLAG